MKGTFESGKVKAGRKTYRCRRSIRDRLRDGDRVTGTTNGEWFNVEALHFPEAETRRVVRRRGASS